MVTAALIKLYKDNPFDPEVKKVILDRGNDEDLMMLLKDYPFDPDIKKTILERGGEKSLIALYKENPFDPDVKKTILERGNENILMMFYKDSPFDPDVKRAILNLKNTNKTGTAKKDIPKDKKQFDFFICHSSEDKESFIDKLASELRKRGINLWYDDFVLEWGDSLRVKINEGLKESRYGIVVFSPSFLKGKHWTEHELDGLLAHERDGRKVILPIWHNVSFEEVSNSYPSLSMKKALKSSELNEILMACEKLLSK